MALFRRRPEIGDQRGERPGERPRFRGRSPNVFPCGKAVSAITLSRCSARALIGRKHGPSALRRHGPSSGRSMTQFSIQGVKRL